ncbi:PREDICTED: uncharacterized protein LOC106748468 isoform X2 [Dinoponera quadriceps]|uniref:Uncharacterized protein LOC106748468 isoform X2 n=1 Tax=Dinoponera quadriceps TaxID=609295 RepID=A0A6P3XVC8_DINQU|nr:PREDICTED: uncharacterized protein LOC106748468 isoform X2 [Dinoponera quadriceps]
MVQCCVPCAKADRTAKIGKKHAQNERKITFHSIPKDDMLRKCWLDILHIKSISNSARVCSLHFDKESFTNSGSISTMKRNALRRKEQEPLTSVNMEVNKENIKVESEVIDIYDNANTYERESCKPLTADKGTMVSPEMIYDSPEKNRLRKRIQYLE